MKLAADIREHIKNLDRGGLLVRMRREINKDTEVHPIVRWQYRGSIREEKPRWQLKENTTRQGKNWRKGASRSERSDRRRENGSAH